MKQIESKLSASIKAELNKKAQVNESSVDPTEDALSSVKMIRASLKKAKLGDKTAFDRITNELNAIERSLTGVSKSKL